MQDGSHTKSQYFRHPVRDECVCCQGHYVPTFHVHAKWIDVGTLVSEDALGAKLKRGGYRTTSIHPHDWLPTCW